MMELQPSAAALTAVILTLIYSSTADSVRLVDGAGRCSGRLEVKAHQSWTTVCEASFDLQDAEVVCRELDCGPPLTLQGALYGEGKHPFGNKEFQCNGTENRLLTCSTSDREEQNCTHGKAVGLTCSDSLSSTIINIKLLVFFVVLFLMLITCLTIFLIFKTSGYFFIKNTLGAVQKTVSLQYRAEEQQNEKSEAGEKLPIDLEQEKDEEQNMN